MEFSRLLEKMARGQRLNDSEVFELQTHARALEEVKNLAKGWVTLGTNSPIFLPGIETIYSQVLNVAAASMTIPIPNAYKHLILLGAGRTTGAGTSADFLLGRYNSDSGMNYINQKHYAVNTTVTAARDTAQTAGIVGLLTQGGHAAGDVSSFFTIIPHYASSSLNKNSLTLAAPHFGSIYTFGSNWDSLDPIQSITLISGADNIAATSVISVYGIK